MEHVSAPQDTASSITTALSALPTAMSTTTGSAPATPDIPSISPTSDVILTAWLTLTEIIKDNAFATTVTICNPISVFLKELAQEIEYGTGKAVSAHPLKYKTPLWVDAPTAIQLEE